MAITCGRSAPPYRLRREARLERAGRARVDRLCGGDERTPVIEHQHQVGADTAQMVVRCGKLGARVAGSHGLAEAEIRGQNADAARELRCAEADHLFDEGAAGAQLVGSSSLDRLFHAREHCDQRHTLCDDDQRNDQHEKSVAETAHRIGSNMEHR